MAEAKTRGKKPRKEAAYPPGLVDCLTRAMMASLSDDGDDDGDDEGDE